MLILTFILMYFIISIILSVYFFFTDLRFVNNILNELEYIEELYIFRDRIFSKDFRFYYSSYRDFLIKSKTGKNVYVTGSVLITMFAPIQYFYWRRLNKFMNDREHIIEKHYD